MLKNYIVAAWRNIRRHKLYAVINIAGLALGISACLIIYLVTGFELSFDKFHPGKERIYRVVSDLYSTEFGADHSGSVPFPVSFAMRDQFTGLETVAVFHNYIATVTIADKSLPVKRFAKPLKGEEHLSDIVIAAPQYFDIFHYDWLAGSPQVLNEPNTVIVTESKAIQYFGKMPPAAVLNKVIIYNDSMHVRVGGIVKDPGKNTDFFFRDFISFSTLRNSFLNSGAYDSWNDSRANEQVFIKLAEGVQPSHINKQLTNLVNAHIKQTNDNKTNWLLQPLSTIHFDATYNDAYSGKVHLSTLYGLMAIALFILVLAIINFITLSTAQSVDRAKETGIRKICGSTVSGLILRFLGETFILTGLAVLLAVLATPVLLHAFRSLIPEGVSFSFFSTSNWIFLLAITVLTALLAGFYPAKILSSTDPVINLKGSATRNRKNYFVKGLIVFQFTISMVFIIATLVIGNQVQFILNKDLGFAKDAIISIQTNEQHAADKKELLAAKIRQLPGVDKVSVSEGTPLAKLHFFNPLIYKGKEEKGASTILEWGDEQFVSLYNIKIIAGRNIYPSDSVKEFLISESCAKALGFENPADAVGKMVETVVPPAVWVTRPVVGVMSDFHSQSLHERLMPVVLTSSKEFTRTVNIKLLTAGQQPGQFKTVVSGIEKLWKTIYPDDPFVYTFFDDTIARFYEKEQQTARLINIAMAISICISCLGLFGLATLTAGRRRKEVGIRKVLGASVAQVVFILNKDTIKLVMIAIVIASPVAWYFMHEWLNGFAYHITISWWVFALAGCIALLIILFTVSYQSVKAALANPVAAIRNE